MQWSMPQRVLQVVAGLIVLIALSAFTLGVINAPQRGRMPGERTPGGGPAGPAPIIATEATPLSQERIEGPPPPPELTPEEKAKQEADKEAKAAAKLAAATSAAAPTASAAPPTEKAGEIPQISPPAPEEPPH
jgi:cell division septation protein DedD